MEVETARFVFARSAGEHLKNSFPVDAFAAASLGLEGSISEEIDVIANHTSGALNSSSRQRAR